VDLSTRRLGQCCGCRYPCPVTAGAVLHRTRIPLPSWLRVIFFVAPHERGISALQLQRDRGIGSYETAWAPRYGLRSGQSPAPRIGWRVSWKPTRDPCSSRKGNSHAFRLETCPCARRKKLSRVRRMAIPIVPTCGSCGTRLFQLESSQRVRGVADPWEGAAGRPWIALRAEMQIRRSRQRSPSCLAACWGAGAPHAIPHPGFAQSPQRGTGLLPLRSLHIPSLRLPFGVCASRKGNCGYDESAEIPLLLEWAEGFSGAPHGRQT
jgi:hypothetical protein